MFDTNLFLFLQRQQLAIAQDMFKESPSLTREQKALILGFMAGSRGQSGGLVTKGICACGCIRKRINSMQTYLLIFDVVNTDHIIYFFVCARSDVRSESCLTIIIDA